MNRPRGVAVYPLPQASGPFDPYALLVRPDGATRMVHSEGVAYLVSEDKPWRWTDFVECDTYTPIQLVGLAFGSGVQPVDLADWIREFGARLEGNFNEIYYWSGCTD